MNLRVWTGIFLIGSLALAAPAQTPWADSTLKSLTLDQQIGQLFMVPLYTRPFRDIVPNEKRVAELVQQYHVGGIICMQGGPGRQVQALNRLQQASPLPLMVSQDAEWGPAMRLDSVHAWPRNLLLGSITNDTLLKELGRAMARQCRAVGVHVSLGPVADVNNNPANPVIGDRAFGAYPAQVTRAAVAVLKGMEAEGVLACGKHFPGHGDTDTDSHLALPRINHSRARLDSVELVPFREIIRQGAASLMVAHLAMPGLEKDPLRPTTLSRSVVTGLLREELGYEGLVFTDALNMGAITSHYPSGQAELEALLAGNDVLLFPSSVPAAVAAIKKALHDGRLTREALQTHVLRILRAKERLGLHRSRTTPVPAPGILMTGAPEVKLTEELSRAAILLMKNTQAVYSPDLALGTAVVEIGTPPAATDNLTRAWAVYGHPYSHAWPLLPTAITPQVQEMEKRRQRQYVVAVYGTASAAQRYGVQAAPELVTRLLGQGKHVTVVLFGTPPQAARYFSAAHTVLVCPLATAAAQQAALEVLMGGRTPALRPPVPVPGYEAPPLPLRAGSFMHARPEQVGADTTCLLRADSLITAYQAQAAMPGGVLLAARGNQVFWTKGYGRLDAPASPAPDPRTTVYDLASVTKVAATTLVAMHLYEKGLLKLGHQVQEFFPSVKGKPLGQVTVRQLLTHESGLPAFLPYWEDLVPRKDGQPDAAWVQPRPSPIFSVPLADSLWLHRAFPDSLFRRVLRAKLSQAPGEKVVYSDLGMIMLGRMLDSLTGGDMYRYARQHLYEPLGLTATLYQAEKAGAATPRLHPWRQVAASEQDSAFRGRTLRGYVNDPTAALLGGHAGHAGLYSTAYDLYRLLLMVQQQGVYAGVRYLSDTTIRRFTAYQHPGSRRGLGWDKPEPDPDKPTQCPRRAGASTFGHLGFTGTSTWADPEHNLIFIFLTNRTYPTARNKLFSDERVRTRVLEYVYQSIGVGPLPDEQ